VIDAGGGERSGPLVELLSGRHGEGDVVEPVSTRVDAYHAALSSRLRTESATWWMPTMTAIR
jgi:hypothetical protein